MGQERWNDGMLLSSTPLPLAQVFIIVIALLSAGLCPAFFPIFPDPAKLPSGLPAAPPSNAPSGARRRAGPPPEGKDSQLCSNFLGRVAALRFEMARLGQDR